MDKYCMPMCKGAKLLVFGAVLVINELYVGYSPWLVVGVLVALKGVFVMVTKGQCFCGGSSSCCCTMEEKHKTHKK